MNISSGKTNHSLRDNPILWEEFSFSLATAGHEGFFKLIRSGLYGTELSASELPTDIDWKQLMSIARTQTMEGVLADAVMRLPSEVKVPTAVKAQLMDTAFKIAKSHALLDTQVAELVRFYRQNGINTVLLKGQGVARCYRNPTMRQCGDIDLYVGQDNYERACQIAKENWENGEEEAEESVKHYHFHKGEVSVELHRIAATCTSIHYKDFRKWMNEELSDTSRLRHVEIKGEPIPLPSPLLDAFFIFYHAYRHLLYGGIGLRQVCDWTLILDKFHGQFDEQALKKVLKHYGLLRGWQIFGNIAVDRFGLAKEKMPFYNPKLKKECQKCLELILEGGNFGFFSKEHIANIREISFVQRKVRLLRKAVRRYAMMFPIIPKDSTVHLVSSISISTVNTIGQILTGRKF